MKIIQQRAIATMKIHLPAGPVMVSTTFSSGPENSEIPSEAWAMSGNKRTYKTGIVEGKAHRFV